MGWKEILGLIGAIVGATIGYIKFGNVEGLAGIGIVGAIIGAFIGVIIDRNS